jgi:hypothetical protein
MMEIPNQPLKEKMAGSLSCYPYFPVAQLRHERLLSVPNNDEGQNKHCDSTHSRTPVRRERRHWQRVLQLEGNAVLIARYVEQSGLTKTHDGCVQNIRTG